MTIGPMPLCYVCKHLLTGAKATEQSFTCEAYPNDIPFVILASDVDHREPYDGDDGIMFEPNDAEAIRYAEELFSDK